VHCTGAFTLILAGHPMISLTLPHLQRGVNGFEFATRCIFIILKNKDSSKTHKQRPLVANKEQG